MAASIRWANAWEMLCPSAGLIGGMGLRELRIFLAQLDLGVLFLGLRTGFLAFLCVLIFLQSLKERPGPALSLGVSSLQPSSQGQGKSKPGHSNGNTPWLYFFLWKKKKKKRKNPHRSPFVPLQTLRRFWREGEVILCMCEREF